MNFSEPLSFLQRLTEDNEYAHILHKAAQCKDSCEQLAYVAAFTVSSYSTTTNRSAKPFNPLLGETYECDRTEDLGWRSFTEQVQCLLAVNRILGIFSLWCHSEKLWMQSATGDRQHFLTQVVELSVRRHRARTKTNLRSHASKEIGEVTQTHGDRIFLINQPTLCKVDKSIHHQKINPEMASVLNFRQLFTSLEVRSWGKMFRMIGWVFRSNKFYSKTITNMTIKF